MFQGSAPDKKALMIGLDGSGKTTILYKLKLGEMVTTIPTIGFNVENIELRGAQLTIWDVGGQEKIRPLWRHYYHKTVLLIWVMDAAAARRNFSADIEEVTKLAADDELKEVKWLFIWNKMDLPTIPSAAELKSMEDQLRAIADPASRRAAAASAGDDDDWCRLETAVPDLQAPKRRKRPEDEKVTFIKVSAMDGDTMGKLHELLFGLACDGGMRNRAADESVQKFRADVQFFATRMEQIARIAHIARIDALARGNGGPRAQEAARSGTFGVGYCRAPRTATRAGRHLIPFEVVQEILRFLPAEDFFGTVAGQIMHGSPQKSPGALFAVNRSFLAATMLTATEQCAEGLSLVSPRFFDQSSPVIVRLSVPTGFEALHIALLAGVVASAITSKSSSAKDLRGQMMMAWESSFFEPTNSVDADTHPYRFAVMPTALAAVQYPKTTHIAAEDWFKGSESTFARAIHLAPATMEAIRSAGNGPGDLQTVQCVSEAGAFALTLLLDLPSAIQSLNNADGEVDEEVLPPLCTSLSLEVMPPLMRTQRLWCEAFASGNFETVSITGLRSNEKFNVTVDFLRALHKLLTRRGDNGNRLKKFSLALGGTFADLEHPLMEVLIPAAANAAEGIERVVIASDALAAPRDEVVAAFRARWDIVRIDRCKWYMGNVEEDDDEQ